MLKKISLLVSLVMILSLSCVAFATDGADLLTATPAKVSGEVSGETISGEIAEVSGDENKEVSGEVSGEEVSGETAESGENTPSTPDTTTPDTTTDDEPAKSNNTVVGAIIAIVIVIAVVAIVYVIQKK